MDAAAIASQAFGARSGPKLAELLRSGRIGYDEFLKKINGGKDTITAAGKSTVTMGSKFKTLKNSLLVAIEPLASGLMEKGTNALLAIVPVITKVIDKLSHMPSWANKAVAGFAGLAASAFVVTKLAHGVTKVVAVVKTFATGAKSAVQGAAKFAGQLKDGALAAGRWAASMVRSAAVTAKDTAIKVAAAAKSAALAVATKATAAAQWLLNAAMTANPITLVVLAIVALVAIFVVAYKKIGWFHDGVNAAFRGIKAAIMGTFHWVQSNWPLLLAILTGPIGLAVLVITRNWDTIKAGAAAAKDYIVSKFGEAVDFIKGLPGRILGVATAFLNAGKMLGGSIISGLENGLTGAVGLAGDIAGSVWRTIKRVVNSNIIDKLNAGIPNSLGKGPFRIDLPDNPIPRLHSGGPVTGPSGSEQLRILQAGEWVLSRAQVATAQRGRASGAPSASGGPLIGNAYISNGVDLELVARRLDYELSAA